MEIAQGESYAIPPLNSRALGSPGLQYSVPLWVTAHPSGGAVQVPLESALRSGALQEARGTFNVMHGS